MDPNSEKESPEPRYNKKRKPCCIRKVSQETLTNVSFATPAENSYGKFKSIWDDRKRRPCHIRKFPQETPTNFSSATPAENSYERTIWNDSFPFGNVIDKNFITEKDRNAFEEWGFKKYFHVLKAGPIQLASIGRCMEQKVNDLEKKNKAYIEQVTELENKLSESEKNVGKLKKDLEELSSEKNRVMAREEELMEENSKIKLKLEIKERIIGILEADVEELKAEIPLHHRAGFDKAVKQVLVSVSELKP